MDARAMNDGLSLMLLISALLMASWLSTAAIFGLAYVLFRSAGRAFRRASHGNGGSR